MSRDVGPVLVQIIEAESDRIKFDTKLTPSDIRTIAEKMEADSVEWIEFRTGYGYYGEYSTPWESRPETDVEMMKRLDKVRRAVAAQRRSEETTRKRELTMLANLKAKYEPSPQPPDSINEKEQ